MTDRETIRDFVVRYRRELPLQTGAAMREAILAFIDSLPPEDDKLVELAEWIEERRQWHDEVTRRLGTVRRRDHMR